MKFSTLKWSALSGMALSLALVAGCAKEEPVVDTPAPPSPTMTPNPAPPADTVKPSDATPPADATKPGDTAKPDMPAPSTEEKKDEPKPEESKKDEPKS